MKIKFLKQVSADFLDHHYDAPECHGSDKTFYHNQIVECDHLEETVNGFVDIMWPNGDAAIGINKQHIQVIEA